MSNELVQQFYVGYYGRPADVEGRAFWVEQLAAAGGDFSAIQNQFAASEEYNEFVLNNNGVPRTNSELVNFIYGNLFGREAEAEGLDFYVSRLDSGEFTLVEVVKRVIDGAQNEDLTAFNNKVVVAEYFTDNLGDRSYTSDDILDARAVLAGVDETPDSVVTGQAAADEFIDALPEEPEEPGVPGDTFTLTTSVDNIVGTENNDTFIGGTAEIQAADFIDGKGGTDRANLFLDGGDASLNATSVENFFIQATGGARTFTASNVVDAQQFWTTGSGTNDLTVDNIQNNVVLGAKNTLGNATDDFVAKFKSGALGSSSATLGIVADGAGSTTNFFEFDVTTAGTDKFTTLEVTGQNTKSFIEVDYTAGNLTTINGLGDVLVKLGDAGGKFANVSTVDLSKSTGGFDVDLATSANAKNVTFTGGTGNDTVRFAASQFTVDDKIDGGAGDLDTIIVGDADLTTSTNATVKAFNAATNVEVAGSGVIAGDGIQIKASVFTNIDTFTFGPITPVANVADADGDNAATLTGVENDDTFIVTGDMVGGTSAAGDSSGGHAIIATMNTNTGSDVLNLIFKAGAAVDVEGGDSQDASANGGKVSGDGLNASTIETINITTDSADDDVAFIAGVADGTDTAGASFRVGANATVNITGAGDVDLGTVVAPSADTDDLTIDGSGMTGKLEVTTGAGNDTITGGSKGDVINAGAGTNTLTGNDGSDEFQFAPADSAVIGSQTVITDFQAGAGGDLINELTGGNVRVYDALAANERTSVANEDTLAQAVNLALTFITDNNWTAFEYGDTTYALYRNDDATFDAGEEILVELTGVTVTDLVAANFA